MINGGRYPAYQKALLNWNFDMGYKYNPPQKILEFIKDN